MISAAMGGVRFGPGVCGADAPSSGLSCARRDLAADHADGKHSRGLKGGHGGQTSWLVTDEQWERWAWFARSRAGEHECHLPDPAYVGVIAKQVEAWGEGVRQAMTWLRADYEFGTGPDWRERGAEWIADRLADHTRTAASEVDRADVEWRCPECLRLWHLDQDWCHECGRAGDPYWRKEVEWAGQELWNPGLLLGTVTVSEDGLGLTVSGGWCTPSETLYDLKDGGGE